MKFSVGNFPRSWQPEHDEDVIASTIDHSLLADKLGYSAIFFPEHHFTGYAPTGSDIFQIGAYLAPQLKQAWIGYSVVVVPHHHPAHLAEQMNLLDQLAKGKVLFGLGSGIRAEEALGLGVDDTRHQMSAMMSEVFEAAEQLWDKPQEAPPLHIETRYYKADLFERIVPVAYRKRRPNMMAVAGKPASIARAVKHGWPVFVGQQQGWNALLGALSAYRDGLAQSDHTPEIMRHCMEWTTFTYQGVFVADSEAEAFDTMMDALASHDAFQQRQMKYIRAAEELGGQERRFDPPPSTSPLHYEPTCLWGTPDQVAAKIERFEKIGMGNMLLVFNAGVDSPTRRKAAERSMIKFATEVMPRFAASVTPSDPKAIDLGTHRFIDQQLAYV